MTPDDAVLAVRAALRDEDRRAPWRGNPNQMAGHCYVASEAVYHLLGRGTPHYVHVGDATHWYLVVDGTVVDPTSDQFDVEPPYANGRGCGFLTRQPSQRTSAVLGRIHV